MKSNETNQTQRSEEINWTERELSLAEQLDIEPEAVRLIDSLRERVDENAKTEITKRLREITGSESDIGEVEHEQLLAKRFNVPIDKVRKLGGLASVLLERMLKEQADEQEVKAETTSENAMMKIQSTTEIMLCEVKSENVHRVIEDDQRLNRDEVIAGFVARWQRIVTTFKDNKHKLALKVHGQTMDTTEDILGEFFDYAQRSWMNLPEYLPLKDVYDMAIMFKRPMS